MKGNELLAPTVIFTELLAENLSDNQLKDDASLRSCRSFYPVFFKSCCRQIDTFIRPVFVRFWCFEDTVDTELRHAAVRSDKVCFL